MYVKLERVYSDGFLDEDRTRFVTNGSFGLDGEYKLGVEEFSIGIVTEILAIDGVVSLTISSGIITVQKDSSSEWGFLKPQILKLIMEHVVISPSKSVGDNLTDNEVSFVPTTDLELGVKKILDDRIAPAIVMDGGDIDFLGIDDLVVKVRLKGACVGCPSSSLTLKVGIERMLKHYFPEIVSVVNVE